MTVLMVGLAVAVGVLVGVVTNRLHGQLITRLQADYCRSVAALLAYNAGSAASFEASSLQDLAEQSLRSRRLRFIEFLHTDGTAIRLPGKDSRVNGPATTGMTPGTTIGSPRFLADGDGQRAYLDVTYPVHAGQRAASEGKLLGYVRIGVNVDHTMADIAATQDLLSGISSVVLAAIVPLGFIAVRSITVPIKALAATMVRFARGDETARLDLPRCDEIGALVASYNRMADTLTRQRRQILELNAHLEARVQERTQQLRELAARDPLTGLYNRRHFNEFLEQRFAESRRYPASLSCLMIDLDNFKQFNDEQGHQQGDQLLQMASECISGALRGADIAARYGGDEFVVLLPQTDEVQATVLARRIVDRFATLAQDRFPQCTTTISAGVGTTSAEVDAPTMLVRAADEALYSAKRHGKNAVVSHPTVPA